MTGGAFLTRARELADAADLAARAAGNPARVSLTVTAALYAARSCAALRDSLPASDYVAERRALRACERDARRIAAALSSPAGSDAFALGLDAAERTLRAAAERLAVPALREALGAA